MFRNRRILVVVIALIMAISIVPAMAFADTTAGSTQSVTVQKSNTTLLDYVEASRNTTDSRIGQYGTTNVKQYFFHGSSLEAENGGKAQDAYPYANTYGYKYKILTDTSVKAYWDNYIQDKPDSTKDIKFGFFLGGSQTAQGSDDKMKTKIVPKMSVQDMNGTIVLSGEQIYAGWKHQRIANGGGTGGGPLRGFDVYLNISANELKENTKYQLVFDEGMGMSTLLDKKIVFNFTTAPIKVSKVQLDSAERVLKQQQSLYLKATVAPDNATNKAVAWTSSNKKVATVDQNGKVTGKSGGDATIRATAKDGSKISASCKIKVIGKTAVTAKEKTYNSVKLSWKKVSGADGYTLYRYNSAAKKYKAIKTTKARGYMDSGLQAGKGQSYRVKAYRTINKKRVYGDYSTKATAVARPITPKTKAAARKGAATISWKAVEKTANYVIYKSTKKDSGFYKERITVKTKYKDTNLKKGKTYYYKVKAYKEVHGKKIYSSASKLMKVRAK